jgi:hypothetical protein
MHCSQLIGPPSAHWTTCTAAFRPPGRDAIPGRKHAASRRRIRRAPTLPGGCNALIVNGLGLPTSSAPWVAAGVAVRVFSSRVFSSLLPFDGDRRKRVRSEVLKAMPIDADDAENRYRFEPARPLVEKRRLTRRTRWPETDGETEAIP